MKRLGALLSVSLLLAACGGSTVVYYKLAIRTDTPEQRDELIAASMRVVERRLSHLAANLSDKKVQVSDDEVTLKLEIDSSEAADALTAELIAPFSLRVMQEAPTEKADIVVEGHGGFSETGLTQKHLQWVIAGKDEGGKGSVQLLFTPEGRTIMGKVFKENKGKSIGLFVREKLVSKLTVESAEVKDDIIITDIPSAEMAEIFADDVNVGLRVTFTPST
ncbi:MAG: hypothetical protein Q7R81_02010 [Candidatus Peregrinibacteria bacterium]|nr:hypothetical protein [Candidatus Peregrinibacteria bacterium]